MLNLQTMSSTYADNRPVWSSSMDEASTGCHLADLTSIDWAMLARDRRRFGRAQMCRDLGRITVLQP